MSSVGGYNPNNDPGVLLKKWAETFAAPGGAMVSGNLPTLLAGSGTVPGVGGLDSYEPNRAAGIRDYYTRPYHSVYDTTLQQRDTAGASPKGATASDFVNSSRGSNGSNGASSASTASTSTSTKKRGRKLSDLSAGELGARIASNTKKLDKATKSKDTAAVKDLKNKILKETAALNKKL